MDNDLNELNEMTESNDDLETPEALPFKRYSLTSYGIDFDVKGLVNRLQGATPQIYIPDFQRGYIWKPDQASQLIETLLFGLPVPGIFISRAENARMLVIDGHQRLITLKSFYEETFPNGKIFSLTGVQENYLGKTYSSLTEEDRNTLDNSVIRATVLQQNAPEETFSTSIYFVFRRLNSNATPLSAQEVRTAIFEGNLNDLLKDLDQTDTWIKVIGTGNRKRKRGQELILRFFALFLKLEEYAEHNSMDAFLTQFMQRYRRINEDTANQWRTNFISVIDTIASLLSRPPFRRSARGPFNAAVFDAISVGVAHRLTKGEITNRQQFEDAYDRLLNNERFQQATEKATGRTDQLETRISLAIEHFKAVK